jgi:hypothetical protein
VWLFDIIIANPVPVIMGVLAIAAAWYLNYKNKKIKSFHYEILTDEPILTSAEKVSGKIKIYYEENQDNKIQIKDGSLLIINFVNDGNIPIKADDFYEPASISFSPKVDVLSAEIIKTTPEILKSELDVSKNQIALKPLLLNQGDSITIKALLMGFRKGTTINVNARIVDVPEIKAVEKKRKYQNWFNFKSLDLKYYSYMILSALTISLFLISTTIMSSSPISVNPDIITAQVGEEREAAISVPDEYLISKIMNDRGIIIAGFADSYDAQPNINITIQPNSFLSTPALAKMKIRIGPNVKAGIYKIALGVSKGFDKRTTSMFVEVVAGNRTK